ncbi:MAG: serine protease [Clostridia bacterium]|nr:serine protease [Clostridia bacterium]
MTGSHYCGRKRFLTIILAVLMTACVSCACAAGFSDAPEEIEQAALSVLMLTVYDEDGDAASTGSGFVMFDNQTLVTNYHVVDEAYSVVAESDDGRRYDLTRILIADEENDIAVLRFEQPTAMEPLPYSVVPVKRGSSVVAIGSPIGLKNTVSMGNVSSVYYEDGVNWIQITAPISHGSSGGALFNDEGEVIGITSAYYEGGQNLNLAISMADVVNLYRQWDGETTFAVKDHRKALDTSYWTGHDITPPIALTKTCMVQEARMILRLPEGYSFAAVKNDDTDVAEIWTDDETVLMTVQVWDDGETGNYRNMTEAQLDEEMQAWRAEWEEDGLTYRGSSHFRAGNEVFLRSEWFIPEDGEDVPMDVYIVDYTTVRRGQVVCVYSLCVLENAEPFIPVFNQIMQNVSFY